MKLAHGLTARGQSARKVAEYTGVVWFFPAVFVALPATTMAEARNLAVCFTIPCGYLIDAGPFQLSSASWATRVLLPVASL